MNLMPRIKLLIGLAAFVVLYAGQSRAAVINGSVGLAEINSGQNGANLSVSTQFTSAFAITSGTGVSDFAAIPLGSVFNTTTLDLTNFGAFSLSNATYGSFAASSGSIIHQTASFLDVELTGIYTPGPGFSGLTAAPSTAELSFNQFGTSLSGSLVLGTTPAPEPTTLVLFGIGAAALLVAARRRRAQLAA